MELHRNSLEGRLAYEKPADIDYSRYAALKMTLRERVLTITLSNPGRRNAVTPAMSDELARIWDDVWQDEKVAVVILTGEGDAFCAGVDLALLKESDQAPAPPSVLNVTTRIARKHVMGILDCEKPVIAKVRGPAFGLGATLALACDMVFAAPGALICDSHVKAGLVAGDGAVLLWPLAVGFHRAKEYLMTGDPVPADVAERIGLINRCVPDAELDAHVQALAEKLCNLPPHAVNYTKVSMNVALKQMTQSGFEASLAYEIYSMRMADHKEAMDAFAAKRRGTFSGN
jgi:enoyl-CoA hydratase